MKRGAILILGGCAVTPLLLLMIVSLALARPAPPRHGNLASIEGVDPRVMEIVTTTTNRVVGQQAGCDLDPILVLAHMSIEWPPGLTGDGVEGARMSDSGDFFPIVQAYAPVPGPDTDGGTYDGSSTNEYAVGPLQQINAFRTAYSFDGNDDGEINQNNLADATASEALHACAARDESGLSLQTAAGRIFEAGHYMLPAYPRSAAAADYGAMVETAYQRLRRQATWQSGGQVVGRYAFPVDRSLITDEAVLWAPHHDYPAWDFPVATGTTVYAMAGGTVIVAGWSGDCGNSITIDADDGGRYTYCHGSQVLVESGTTVAAGDPIMLTGSTGASTGPHLHIQINVGGQFVCPQPALDALFGDRVVDLGAVMPVGSASCSY